MNIEKLNQQLFSNTTRVYVVLDGASVPDLPLKLYEMKPPHFCLFSGELEPDLAEVAPYLVQIHPKTPFAEWIASEFWGKNWGVFLHSRKALKDMRKHFRSLVTVYDETGNPMTFRFYDPRVLRRFLPTCNAAELKVFFGDVEKFFAESADEKKLTGFHLAEENNLNQSEIDFN